MIGIIVTGHANFASGIISSLKLIAGNVKCIESVDFLQTDSTDDLENNLRKAVNILSECEGIIILCDLMGGSPFKSSVMISQETKNCRVIYGTNLPLLLEISMIRTTESDVDTCVKNVLNSVNEQIGYFKFKPIEIVYEEGI